MRRAAAAVLALALLRGGFAAEYASDMRDFKGVATWADQWGFCLQSGDIAFFVEGRSRGEVSPGTVVEVQGEPFFRGRGGDLRRTRFAVRGTAPLPVPRRCSVAEILASGERMPEGMNDFYGLRVSVEGTLVDMDESPSGFSVLSVRDGDRAFDVRVRGRVPDAVSSLREERPTVRATGACLLHFPGRGADGVRSRGIEVEILVPDSSGVELVKDAAYARIVARRRALAVFRGAAFAVAAALVFLLVKLAATRAKLRRLEAVTAERRRLAADLHDGIEQHFAGIGLVLGTSLGLCPDTPAPVADAIGEATKMLARAKAEMRATIWDLRSDALLGLTPAAALGKLADEICAKGLVVVRHELAALPEKLPEGMLANLVCIVQETVTNAVKHGRARRVVMRALAADGGWMLKIANDGAPFDPGKAPGAESGHFGLAGIAHRAHRFGMRVEWSRDGRVLTLLAGSAR